MNKWISVKDKLPEKDNWKVYAVLTNDNTCRKYEMAWFQYSDKTFRREAQPNIPINVTHWLILPPRVLITGKIDLDKSIICEKCGSLYCTT